AGDGAVRAFVATDQPDLDERPLLHQMNLRLQKEPITDVWQTFLRRVVLRGRYNQLYLNLLDSVAFPSMPGIAHKSALSQAEVRELIATARAYGVEVFPAVSAPGNASWMIRAHKGLASSGGGEQLCPRNPEVPERLERAYTDLLHLFDHPRRVHIGHDEARWRPDRVAGDERDPFCAGVPPRVLFEESLQWHIDFFHRQDAEPVAWVDMLVNAWNGGNDVWRARRALDPESVILASWAQVGDNAQVLLDEGFRVQRIHTGYHDWRRTDLVALKDRISGEGLGLFYPFPWAAFGHPAGQRPVWYHWSRVLLAGATAWRTDLAEASIAATLHHAADLPAYQPNRRHHDRGLRPVVAMGGTGSFEGRATVRAGGAPLTFGSLPPTPAVTLHTAVMLDRAAEQRLHSQYTDPRFGPPVLMMRVTYADGEIVEAGLRYGLETYRYGPSRTVASLWNAAGVDVGDGRRMWEWTWTNPRPDAPIEDLSVLTQIEGAVGLIGF
ncbi:MAG: family 20 glycosylhydrolase, partial [Myxococcota bacterium]